MSKAKPKPNIWLEIQAMAKAGLGHRDIFVNLKRRGFVRRGKDEEMIRRYVLNLGSEIVKRYGT